MSLFSENIKRLRAQLDMSQEEFGELIGVSRDSIKGYEKGDSMPKADAMIALGNLTGKTPSELRTKQILVFKIDKGKVNQAQDEDDKESQNAEQILLAYFRNMAKVPELEQMIKQHIATYLQADTEMKMELGVVSKRLEDAFEQIEALKKQLLKSTK